MRMSQQQIADALGISQQGVWKWEKGINEPDSDTLIKLADMFDCSVDYLLGRTNHKKAFILEGDALPPELRGKDLQLEVIQEIADSGLTDEQIKRALKIYKLYAENDTDNPGNE